MYTRMLNQELYVLIAEEFGGVWSKDFKSLESALAWINDYPVTGQMFSISWHRFTENEESTQYYVLDLHWDVDRVDGKYVLGKKQENIFSGKYNFAEVEK